MDITVQAIGFVALVLNVASLQFKNRKRLLLFNMAAATLMAVHFALLGAYTAAGLFAVAIVRAGLFSRFNSENRPLWPVITMLTLFMITGAVTWHGFISLLPMISTIFVTIGLWQVDTQRTRKLVIVGLVLWIAHNVLVGSIAGVINEVISLFAVIVGLWRHRKQDTKLVEEAASSAP